MEKLRNEHAGEGKVDATRDFLDGKLYTIKARHRIWRERDMCTDWVGQINLRLTENLTDEKMLIWGDAQKMEVKDTD